MAIYVKCLNICKHGEIQNLFKMYNFYHSLCMDNF